MAALFDLTKYNFSYYTVPAAFAIAMVPQFYSSFAAGRNMDLAYPRKTEEHCVKDTTMDKAIVRRIHRAKAATANGLETLGFFSAGVVAANVAGLPVASLNLLSLGYLASRLLYNFVYVSLQSNSRFAPLRSLMWTVGIAQVCALYIMAGNKLNRDI